jgi:CDP-glycerol glycerophosphotransferase (TagB/SpsB family)
MTRSGQALRGLLRAADHALGRLTGKTRVLADARTPMNLAVLQPLCTALGADDRIELLTASETAPIDPWTRVDLAMSADFWHQTPLHRCRRRLAFFHGVAGKYDLDRPERLGGADLRRLDRLAFINRERMDRYLASGAVTPEQAVLVGYPKVDGLLQGAWPAAQVRASLGLPPATPTVLYAPTFSTANSLHLAGECIIATLLASGCNVIVKLHDRSMVPHPKHTDGIDWPARLQHFERHSNFALAREADASPYLSAADVLVTDHSTVGFEFALLDRPLVVVDAPRLRDAARIDEGKWRLLRGMADVVTTPDDLRDAVTRALAAPARLHAERRRAHDLFAYAGGATERALKVVYELLDLEPHRAPGSTPVAIQTFR